MQRDSAAGSPEAIDAPGYPVILSAYRQEGNEFNICDYDCGLKLFLFQCLLLPVHWYIVTSTNPADVADSQNEENLSWVITPDAHRHHDRAVLTPGQTKVKHSSTSKVSVAKCYYQQHNRLGFAAHILWLQRRMYIYGWLP